MGCGKDISDVPETSASLRLARTMMIIGTFGFYQKWLEWYEVHIAPYRKLQVKAPPPGFLTKDEEHEIFAGFWLPEHQALFDELKAEIMTKPVLA